MEDRYDWLSSDGRESNEARLRRVADFWNAFDSCGESGATTLEVLEEKRLQVSDCLAAKPPDVRRAESLTAQALLLIIGGCDQ